MTVSGLTMTSAVRRPVQFRERHPIDRAGHRQVLLEFGSVERFDDGQVQLHYRVENKQS
jgi:hypothetical protein